MDSISLAATASQACLQIVVCKQAWDAVAPAHLRGIVVEIQLKAIITGQITSQEFFFTTAVNIRTCYYNLCTLSLDCSFVLSVLCLLHFGLLLFLHEGLKCSTITNLHIL